MTPKEFADKYYKDAAYLHLTMDIDDTLIENGFTSTGEHAEFSQDIFSFPERYNIDLAELAEKYPFRLYILGEKV